MKIVFIFIYFVLFSDCTWFPHSTLSYQTHTVDNNGLQSSFNSRDIVHFKSTISCLFWPRGLASISSVNCCCMFGTPQSLKVCHYCVIQCWGSRSAHICIFSEFLIRVPNFLNTKYRETGLIYSFPIVKKS